MIDFKIRRTTAPVFFITYFFLLLTNFNTVKSDSGDMAHHYILAFGIAENWSLDYQQATNLGGMNFYPRLSHTAAALIGYPFGSTFIGMQLVTLLSVAIIWVSVSLILSRMTNNLFAASCLLIFFVLIAKTSHLNLVHGAEVVDNFFYPQLVGFAILYVALWASSNDKKFNFRAAIRGQLVFSVIGVLLLQVHLIPAFISLGIAGFLVFIKYVLAEKPSVFFARFILLDIISISGLAIIVLTSDSFASQAEMSLNDGELKLGPLPFPSGWWIFVLICFLLAALELRKILWTKHDSSSARAFWILLGFSASIVAALQGLIIQFGFGSNYAAKKYTFVLFTFLLVEVALFLSHRTKIWTAKSLNLLIMLLLPSSLAIISLAAPTVFSTSSIVSLERDLQILKPQLPIPEEGKSNVVDQIHFLPSINYMFAVSITNTDPNQAQRMILQKNTIQDYLPFDYVLGLSSGKKILQYENCPSSLEGRYYLVKAACVQEKFQEVASCEGAWDFSVNGIVPARSLMGFGDAEDGGRWTVGGRSEIKCKITNNPPRKITLEGFPFFYKQLNMQNVKVKINNQIYYDKDLSSLSNDFTIDLDLEDSLNKSSGSTLTIQIETPKSKSPLSLGMNQDSRLLGFYLRNVLFVPSVQSMK